MSSHIIKLLIFSHILYILFFGFHIFVYLLTPLHLATNGEPWYRNGRLPLMHFLFMLCINSFPWRQHNWFCFLYFCTNSNIDIAYFFVFQLYTRQVPSFGNFCFWEDSQWVCCDFAYIVLLFVPIPNCRNFQLHLVWNKWILGCKMKIFVQQVNAFNAPHLWGSNGINIFACS